MEWQSARRLNRVELRCGPGHFAELIVGLASKISAPVSLAKHDLVGQQFAFSGTYSNPIVADAQIRAHLGVKGGSVIDRWQFSSKDSATIREFVNASPRAHQSHQVCGAKDLKTKEVIALWCVRVRAKILTVSGQPDRPILKTAIMLATTTQGAPRPGPGNPRADFAHAAVIQATSCFSETDVAGIAKAEQFEALVHRASK